MAETFVSHAAETVSRHAPDVAIGAMGASTLFIDWLDWIHASNELAGWIAAWGGAGLVLIRLALAWKEYRKGRR